jgi:mycothiol synthase
MHQRPYQNASDLILLQDFNARAIAEAGGCGYVHPGDIPHRLFNGNRLFDPGEVMTIWEDERGVAAWLMAGPRHRSYDLQVRPDLRGDGFEGKVLAYADQRLVELMRVHDYEGERIYGEAYRCDTIRSGLLLATGWDRDDHVQFVLNRAKIGDVRLPPLPAGYTLRSATGVEDAGGLAAVHRAAFGVEWTAESYGKVMGSPGYSAESELVVVAPDGVFVAFTKTWLDRLNRTGLFEPVGTHKDYWRRGFGRAVLLYGMRQMAAAGMEYATVANSAKNEAARELYRACGFEPWHDLDGYSKLIAA